MAANDYSRRSKKDVFWGDDNNKNSKSDELEELFRTSEALEQTKAPEQKPEPTYEPDYSYEPEPAYEPEPTYEPEPLPIDYNSNFNFDSLVVNEEEPQQDESMDEPQEEPLDETLTPPSYEPQSIVPPPYIPTQNTSPSTKSKEEVLEGFDVEKFIKDNDTNFTMTIIAKVVSVGLCVYMLLKWLFRYPEYLGLVILVATIAYWVIELIFNGRYSSYISQAIKSIKNVTAFNKNPKKTTAWAKMLNFPYNGVNDHAEDELTIVADETTVTSQEMQFIRKVGKSSENLLMCECYRADMEGRTPFADQITLIKGRMPFAKGGKFNMTVSQYLLYTDDATSFDQCNMPRLCAIADKVAAHLGKKSFVMFFDSYSINLATPIDHLEKFDYHFFDYTLEDRIRRDASAIVNRVQVANLLAEN